MAVTSTGQQAFEDLSGRFRQRVPLACYATIKIGGPARWFAEAHSLDELREQLSWARSQNVPALLLGGGSNILFSDEGYPGLVIRLLTRGMQEQSSTDGKTIVTVAGGEDWDAFVAHCVQRNLQGVECLSGIPGSVGASPIQNIGAYGQEVKDTITEVQAMDRLTGELQTFNNEDCQFSYRMSRFKAADQDRYVVTAVSFALTPGESPNLRYGDISRYFEANQVSNPTLVEVREAVLKIRGTKAMVIDENEPNSRSCGSFFMNPIVSTWQFQKVLEAVETRNLLREGEKMPAFPAGEGYMKLSAAWLMERSGLKKGFVHGNVGLSQKHVLAVVNRGGGTAAEVLELVAVVQAHVQDAFAIKLEPEPNFIGF